LASSGSSCELCGTSKFAEIEVAKHYTGGQPLHVCKNCGFVQVLDRRSPKEIFEAWQDQKPGDDVYKSAKAAVVSRLSYVASFVGDTGLTLDIGSGDGTFGKIVKNVTNYNGMAEDIGVHSLYDTVTLLWTLENCGSAVDVLKAAHKVLRHGGKLVVATGSRIGVPFKKPLWAYLGDSPLDLHPWRFSRNTLEHTLSRAGFRVVRANPYLSNDYLVIVAEKRGAVIYPLDGHEEVIDFFNRWHEETERYYPDTTR